MDANAKRGLLSNLIGLLILGLGSWSMGLTSLAGLALVINWAVYLVHALPQNSEKYFDATGSCTYLTLVVFAVASHWSSVTSGHNFRQVITPIMMTVWCLRLGTFLLTRIKRDSKDSRFDEIKKHWLRFLGVWTIQSLWCLFVASPVLIMVTSPSCAGGPTLLDYVGWAAWACGFCFEVAADQQKSSFSADPANKGRFITSGLWAYSRHPNYFGEITMWIGICISGSSCFHRLAWIAWLSPLTTVVLLLKVSGVPMLESRGEQKWGADPAYRWYMEHTPCIVPALRRPPLFSPSSEPLLSQ